MMYPNLMGTRNNRTNFQSIPRPFPPHPREVVLEPWRLFQERAISGPFAVPPSHPDHQMIYVDNQRRPTPSFPEPSSSLAPTTRPQSQQGSRWISGHSLEDESKLTHEEQKQALNKLKKEVYFPKRGRRPNLYFREHYNSINHRGKENDDEDEDGKRCAVCLDDFEAREVVMVTPCNHMFHEDCIIPWVKTQGRCPVCRYAICERFKENAATINVMGNHHEPYVVELISVITAMEEAFMLENTRRLY